MLERVLTGISFLSTQITFDLDQPTEAEIGAADISVVPEALVSDKDDRVNQSEVLDEIIGTCLQMENDFDDMRVHKVKLSTLKDHYENDNVAAVALLSSRHRVHIDDDFRLRVGAGQIQMETKTTAIDYHLTVANCMGLSPLLPNTESDHRFEFEMDLKKPILDFKGKHAMLGFDPTGRMLYIGHCTNENVFLAMAPNEFLRGEVMPTRAGHSSSSPTMSTRHYRQMVMMIAHFLERVPQLPFSNMGSVYDQDLNSEYPNFEDISNAL